MFLHWGMRNSESFLGVLPMSDCVRPSETSYCYRSSQTVARFLTFCRFLKIKLSRKPYREVLSNTSVRLLFFGLSG